MVLTLIWTGFSPDLVFASNLESYSNYSVETIHSSDKYIKQKITDKITGEIQWLETNYNDDGTSRSIAKSRDEEYTVENNLDEIIVRKDNQLFETIDIKNGSKIKELNFEEINDESIKPYGPWGELTYRYSSRSTRVTLVGAAIAIAAAIFAVNPGASIAITIGTVIIDLNLQNIYYRIGTQTKYDLGTRTYHIREITTAFEVSDYTGYLFMIF